MKAEIAREYAERINKESNVAKATREILRLIINESGKGKFFLHEEIHIPLNKNERKTLWSYLSTLGYHQYMETNMMVISKIESDRFDNWKVDVGFTISIGW